MKEEENVKKEPKGNKEKIGRLAGIGVYTIF